MSVARRPVSRIFHLDAHLFQNMPVAVVRASDPDERQGLLPTGADAKDDGESPRMRMVRRIPMIALAVGATACACLSVVVLLIVVLSYRRFNDTVAAIDGAVNLHQATSGMIQNAGQILNSSAQIAGIVHELGLKGIDASYFSRPFLTRLLNTTAAIADDAHRVLERPRISIGG
jgi:hypothetical protein